MVFAAKGQGVTQCAENVDLANSSAASSSHQRPTSPTEEAGHVSDRVGDGGPSRAGEERSWATEQIESDTVTRPRKQMGTQRQKRRIVRSKFSVPTSARHNKFTHFPLDMNCEICKLVKKTREACRTGTVPEPDGLPPARRFGDRITADQVRRQDHSRS